MLFESLKEYENYNHLDYLYKIDFRKPLIKIRQKQDILSPILIIQYLTLLKKIVRKGLKKSYYKKTTNFHSKVKGKILTKPPIRRISCSSPIAWITEPALKNNNSLKKAWFAK